MLSAAMRGAARSARNVVFYNRREELDDLAGLCSDGSMVLVTGPPDSGKSALLTEFARKMKASGTGYPVYMNMRAGSFSSSGRFARELKSQLVPYLSAVSGMAAETSSMTGDPTTAALASAVIALRESPETDMKALLKSLDDLLSSIRGQSTVFPTLIIDEANRLHEWNEEEHEHLRTLIAYFIMITKERSVANVILSTSEDFFKFWLDSHIGSHRYEQRVVGDLSEDGAREFFLSLFHREREQTFPEDLWREIFSFAGGRILILSQLASRLGRSLEDEPGLRKAWAVARRIRENAAESDLFLGFTPLQVQGEWQRATGVAEPRWSPEEYERVVARMEKAEGGVVSVDSLISSKTISLDSLHSLIQHNFLHYRPYWCPWATDLEWYKGEWPVIMPTSLPRFHAIGGALKKWSGLKAGLHSN